MRQKIKLSPEENLKRILETIKPYLKRKPLYNQRRHDKWVNSEDLLRFK